MKQTIAVLALLGAFTLPAAAQDTNAAAIGVGTGISSSRSGAAAVSGSQSGVVFNTPGNTTNSTAIRQSGTTTVRNVPGVVAPGLAAAGIETCLGSVSGGASGPGFGFAFGSTVTDKGCDARLDSRTLWAFGLKSEAIARLCQKEEIRAAMPDRCGVQTASVQTAPSRAPTAISAPGNSVMLIEGKTGKERLCATYDAAAKRCRQWAS